MSIWKPSVTCDWIYESFQQMDIEPYQYRRMRSVDLLHSRLPHKIVHGVQQSVDKFPIAGVRVHSMMGVAHSVRDDDELDCDVKKKKRSTLQHPTRAI